VPDWLRKAVFGSEEFPEPHESGSIDDTRRIYLLFLLSAAGILTLLPLGTLALYEQSTALGFFDFFLAAVLALNLLHARHYRLYSFNISLGILFTAALFIFAFLTGGKNQSAFVWYYVFPLISSFLIGPGKSLAANLLMLLPVMWLFLGGETITGMAVYHLDFKLRFIPSYLVVAFFAFFAEQSRDQARGALRKVNENLEDTILKRTAELRRANRELEKEIGTRTAAEASLREQVTLLSLVGDVGRALTGGGTLESILSGCSTALVGHLDAAFARIWVVDENDADTLVLKASSGMYTALDGEHARIAVGKGDVKIAQIALERKPILTNAVVGDPRFSNQEWARREGMTAFAGHPLMLEGRLVGVMALFAKQALSDSALNSLAAVADMIAIGIERKRGEEKIAYSEEYLRSIIETNPECVKLVDLEGRIIDINPAGLAMLEADSPDEIRGESILSFIKEEYRKPFVAYNEKVCRGEECSFRFEIVGRRGTSRWLESSAAPFAGRKDGVPLILAVTRDITDARRAEKDLKTAKEDLERQNKELKKLDQIKSAFMYAVSHELKTPVAKHAMQLEILRPVLERHELTERELKIFEVMEESIKRQQRTIRNLLDLTKLESGKHLYRIDDVFLDEVLELVKREHEYAVAAYGTVFEMEAPHIRMRSDREMLWHVLSNLVHNAIKFRRPEGPSRIRVMAEERNGTVTIRVSDDGVGLTPEEKKKVFESFYQASSSIEGTGVGLTICRLIVQGLGGRINIESEGRNRGTTVILELPKEASTAEH
jgi:PAS domain S-box-containing protein